MKAWERTGQRVEVRHPASDCQNQRAGWRQAEQKEKRVDREHTCQKEPNPEL